MLDIDWLLEPVNFWTSRGQRPPRPRGVERTKRKQGFFEERNS